MRFNDKKIFLTCARSFFNFYREYIAYLLNANLENQLFYFFLSSLLYCSSLDAVKTYLLGGNDLLLVIQFLRFYRVYGEDSTNIKTLPMFLNLSRCILFFGGKSATKEDLDIIFI